MVNIDTFPNAICSAFIIYVNIIIDVCYVNSLMDVFKYNAAIIDRKHRPCKKKLIIAE